MNQQGVQTLDMRHTLPNLKNLMLTLTTNLEDDSDTQQRSVAPIEGIAPAATTATSLTDIDTERSADSSADPDAGASSTGTPTPTNNDTPRKPFFAPINISGFWHLRGSSGSSTVRATSGPSAEPSLPSTPELSGAEDSSDVTPPATPPDPETNDQPADSDTAAQDNDPIILPGKVDVSPNVEAGLPLGQSNGTESSTTASTAASTTEEDVDDTETIKDGAVGRPSLLPSQAHATVQQSGWLTKAFFGQQIDRERDPRDKEKDGGSKFASGRRRKTNPVTATSVSPGRFPAPTSTSGNQANVGDAITASSETTAGA